MRRGIFSTSVLAIVFCCASPAIAASPLCPYYGGHVDVEGKLGSKRDIGETSIFIPAACSEDLLLFSDLRFKGDNESNREGNFGLGVRALRETGVLGGYAYFDRKLSGITEKYHSQLTIGGEWLTENWEARINGYVPLTGNAQISTGPASISTPFLSGSGIFARATGEQVIREIPLYGGDIEAGFKIPDTNFWLHAAAFSFNGDDAPSLDGVRARATFQITENIALTAEGQYDDERGRQEWIGARLTIPFGGPAQKPQGVAARMTASPVRDVDIVTQTKTETKSANRLVPILNAETGAAQRVIYVDNSAAGGGNGSMSRPFDNLADAQAALRDHDVLYIAAGLGDSTNMQDGLSLSHRDVQVIGEGSAFIYDGNKFTINSKNNFSGLVLREAGTTPVITNMNSGGDGVTIGASNILLSGFAVENADRYGIYAFESGGNALSNITLHNLSVTGSREDGIRIESANAGSSVTANLRDVTTTGNKNGIRFYARSDAGITGSVQSSLTTANSQHGIIVYDDSTAGSVNVDLGGGGRSNGNNAFYGNTLEDLALDIDGATLSAQNNWWGQASGLYQSAPSGGLKPQIYYGAPLLYDALLGHWTFDNEWMSGTTAYDRSGNGYNGTLQGGLTAASIVSAPNARDGLDLAGTTQYITLPTIPAIRSMEFLANISSTQTSLNHYVFDARTGYTGYLYNGGASGVSNLYVDNNSVGTLYANIPKNTWTRLHVTTSSNFSDNLNIMSRYANGAGCGCMEGLRATISDLRIYNRVITAAERAELHRMDMTSTVDFSSHRLTAP